LVTGASAGIGLGVAHELAKRGFNVIIVGHKSSELEEAKEAIQAESPDAEVMILIVDAVTATAEEVDAALDRITDLMLTVVVNNVSSVPVHNPAMDPVFRELQDYEADVADGVIYSSSRFMLRVCRRLVPVLADNAGRTQSRALIVNVGSAARFGMPLMVPYSASKGFVHAASMALSRELRYRRRPVDVVAILLSNVKTQSNHGARGLGVPDHRQFARALMDRVPRAAVRNMLEVVPWFHHTFDMAFLDLTPECLIYQLIGKDVEDKIAEMARSKKRIE
jgi:17beta-estradiol 17-dehydrogenase / very-long-chain 3-oxoacyl-CoA reductase